MSAYGKRTKPVAASSLSPEALERWRSRARNLLASRSAALEAAEPGPAAEHAPLEPAPDGNAADEKQRRRSVRQKTLIGAKVVFNDLMSVFDCAIRDLSETGARVKLNAPVQVPQVFMLRFGDGQVRRCRVRRRLALELGVEFLD